MLIKTILNRIEKFKSFVYGDCHFEQAGNNPSMIVEVVARKNAKGLCPECHKPSPSYDKQPLRRYQYVPLWNIPVYYAYAPRRINCKAHGVRVELLPWCHGKEQITKSYQLFWPDGLNGYHGLKQQPYLVPAGRLYTVLLSLWLIMGLRIGIGKV